MTAKSAQLQIRVSAAQKAELRRRAIAAGCDVSAYVLACALPDAQRRVDTAIRILRNAGDEAAQRFAFADLADALNAADVGMLERAVAHVDVSHLTPFARNYAAAMVEDACAGRGIAPPEWTRAVEPLTEPWFAAPLRNLRVHLLRVSPLAYKRRNLFIDAGASARV